MRKDKLAVLLVFAGIIAVMVAVQLQRTNGTDTQPAATQPAKAPGPIGRLRGMALQLHYSDESHPYEQLVGEIPSSGADAICFVVHAYQENASSASIFIDRRKTPSDDHLVKLISQAHAQGMRVIIMPIVLLENARTGEWRGKINPPDWSDWWEDYANFITYYAKIAAATGAEVFMVGSELVSTEAQTGRWRDLIGTVRWIYPGLISYSANWDHYRPVKWWDAVDIIGMTTYYDLTGGAEPTLERLTKAWEPIKKDILDWRAKNHPTKPIMFTEVGWPNQETCAQYPWNYYEAPDKPDPTAQANCFEAFFATWIGEPAVSGFIVWEWRSDPATQPGPEDTSYTPCGKPALDVIRKYYQMPTPAAGATGTRSPPPAESRQ